MAKWVWNVGPVNEFFYLAWTEPNIGDEWEQSIWGEPVTGRPGYIHAYTTAVCLRGQVYARAFDGTESSFNGFQIGPGRGESDSTIWPDGDCYFRAESDDVLFVCPAPYGHPYDNLPPVVASAGANLGRPTVDHTVYTGPANVPSIPESWVACLSGEISYDGKTYQQFESVKMLPGQADIDCDPDAIYTHVRRRPT